MGLSLVSLGMLASAQWSCSSGHSLLASSETMYDAFTGYGLASFIPLFGRVGGGIYTKAADVAADLSGKNNFGPEENDYRNPVCFAGDAGDNVGDIAGMGTDTFGSFSESTCTALVLAAAPPDLRSSWRSRRTRYFLLRGRRQ